MSSSLTMIARHEAQAPNLKHQISNKFKARNPNEQNGKPNAVLIISLLRLCCLFAIWCSVLGASRQARADVPQSVLDAEQARIVGIQKAVKTAIAVFANEGNGGGSGVVISPDGYALTN